MRTHLPRALSLEREFLQMFGSIPQGRSGPGFRNGRRGVALLANFGEYPHGRQDSHQTDFDGWDDFSKWQCLGGVLKSL